MKVSKFSEQQIALILKQVDDGLGVDDVCRKAGVAPSRRIIGGERNTAG